MTRKFILLLASVVLVLSVAIYILWPASDDTHIPPGTDGMGIPFKPDTTAAKNDTSKKTEVSSVSVFPVDKGYGYDILMNGKPYIHQPYIPAVQGNQAFTTIEDAQKMGNFVNYKIKKNINPPSVSVKELDSLKIKYKK
jgi:hypothetical protein